MITTVTSIFVYVIGFGFTYCTLKDNKYPDFKAFILSLFWLPVIIVMIGWFTITVVFPNITNSIKQGFNKLKI